MWMTFLDQGSAADHDADGEPVGNGVNGQAGPLAQQMHGWYQQFKDEVMRRG